LTRLLGIDLGARRIGLAVADTASGQIVPLTTLRRGSAERDAATLSRIAREQQVDELILGLPLNMDGSEGEQAGATRDWAGQVCPLLALPLHWRDERLTSELAETRLGGPPRGRSGGPPSGAARAARRARVDRESARLILEAELDARQALARDS